MLQTRYRLVLVSIFLLGVFCYLTLTVLPRDRFYQRNSSGVRNGTKITKTPERCQPQNVERCGYLWQKEYCEFHMKAVTSPNTSKFLSYQCEIHNHGGMGNRIQAIVSIFFLALLTDRVFLINWNGPGHIGDYLEPNQINWNLPLGHFGTFHKSFWGRINAPRGYNDGMKISGKNFLKMMSTTDFDTKLRTRFEAVGTIWWFADQLRKNPFLKKHAAKKGLPSTRLDLFGCIFHFLFRKNTAMLQALQKAKSYLGIKPPLLGIHIRTSDHHWGSTNKHSYLSHNSTLFFLCAREQNKLIHEKVDSSLDLKWFLAADDKEVKDTAKHKYPKEVITLDIIPQHLDFVRQNNDYIRNILLDIFLLAECDIVLLTSGSTFSRLAAAIGFHDKFSVATDGEHCLVNQTSLVRIITHSLRKHRH